MATTVYTTEEVELQDGTTVTLKPLTIKNLRKFMKAMEGFAEATTEDEGLEVMLDSAALCLKAQRPEFWDEKTSKHSEEFEDAVDIPTIYKVLDVCGGIKLNDPKSSSGGSGGSWEELNLAQLEAEVFLLGHWKNFEEIEDNLTLDELQAILEAARDKEYRGQKFAAALKGIDLDEKTGNNDTSFDDIKRRAEAKLHGVSEDEIEFSNIGIAVIEE
ncbi:tail assembly chaperone [Streptomyces phage Stigma]|nr:tail assembly chaperone [Streptomyces phage Stigma]